MESILRDHLEKMNQLTFSRGYGPRYVYDETHNQIVDLEFKNVLLKQTAKGVFGRKNSSVEFPSSVIRVDNMSIFRSKIGVTNSACIGYLRRRNEYAAKNGLWIRNTRDTNTISILIERLKGMRFSGGKTMPYQIAEEIAYKVNEYLFVKGCNEFKLKDNLIIIKGEKPKDLLALGLRLISKQALLPWLRLAIREEEVWFPESLKEKTAKLLTIKTSVDEA